MAAAAPRSARQRCERANRSRNYLAQRHTAIVELGVLQCILREREEEREREADAAALREQKRRRRANWTAEELAAEPDSDKEEGAAALAPELPLNSAADKAVRTAREQLLANSDLAHVLEALQWYYHDDGGSATPDGPLPEKIYIVNSGCIAAQMAHHPEDLDRRVRPTAL